MIQTLFILGPDGDILFVKQYQGLANRRTCTYFWDELQKEKEKGGLPPVLRRNKEIIIHVERSDIFLLAITIKETPPLLVIEFLHRMADIFDDYFSQMSSKVLRENFATVHQLLDEMMDSGFPFTTEPSILKEMIIPPTLMNRTMSALTGSPNVSESVPDITFTSIPWRKQNIKYRTNEIYFDVTEEVDALFEASGTIISGDITGEILCDCRLSGMPEITVSFSKPELLDDCVFHPCVRYSKFEHDKILSFIPPDGQFKLASYKIKGANFKLPIHVKSVISFARDNGQINLSVGSRLIGNPKPADDVAVKMNLPACTIGHSLKATIGHVKFDEKSKILHWIIGSMPRDRLPTLNGNIVFSPDSAIDSVRPDLLVDFKLMSFNISGLQIISVNISNEKSRSYKGARYFTKAGNLQYRT